MEKSELYLCGIVTYDGTNYHGFQYQPYVSTIQGELEKALDSFVTRQSRINGSGRTDSGVHAKGQVISVRVIWRHGIGAFQRAWNSHLPPDICVDKLQEVSDDFHPRFSALSRTYCYRIILGQQPNLFCSPLTDRFALYVPQEIDIDLMSEAAQHLLGTHDFATFGQPPQGSNTVREILRAEFYSVQDDISFLNNYPGSLSVFIITANAFLYKMVRNITGTLLEVGKGNRSPDDVKIALEAKNRQLSGKPVPPTGLIFEQVSYADHWGLSFLD